MASFFHVSERSHIGLILMAALAERYADDGATVRLIDLATNKHVSHGYLEEVANALKQAGLIQGKKGPQGGYVLTRAPAAITSEEVLTALEGPVKLVACQQAPGTCPVEHGCSSRSFWNVLQGRVLETLRTTTLADIVSTSSR